MNVFSNFLDVIKTKIELLVADGTLPEGIDGARVSVEPPRDPTHGDLATNVAMVLAKPETQLRKQTMEFPMPVYAQIA